MAVIWVKPFVIAYRHRRYRFTHVGTDVLGPGRTDLSLKFRVTRLPRWQFWRGWYDPRCAPDEFPYMNLDTARHRYLVLNRA